MTYSNNIYIMFTDFAIFGILIGTYSLPHNKNQQLLLPTSDS